MKQSYYLFSSGTLARKDNSLVLIKDDEQKTNIPIERVRDLYIFSEMQFNSSLMNFIGTKGINLHLFNYYGYYTGSFYPKEHLVSGSLLVDQVEHYQNLEKRLEIAKEFIASAIDNIYRNLRYYNARGKNLKQYMDTISELKQHIYYVNNIQELMGVEGSIRKEYYQAFNIIINQEIDFTKRVKRPPDNMINTMISFCNTLLYTKIISEIYKIILIH